jgi:hypothetical protein
MRTLKGLAGPASFSLQWDSGGLEADYYQVEATLQDSQGQVLDQRTRLFRLGVVAGEITEFGATPVHFEIGDSIHIALAFRNSGTVGVTGAAVIRVQNLAGETVQQFRHDITALAPGSSVQFDDHWETSTAQEGTYSILGYVLYDSAATDPSVAVVSTSRLGERLYLPIITKSYR